MSRQTHDQTPNEWRNAIMQYIADHPDRPFKAHGLRSELNVPPEEAAAFRAVLREMLDAGELLLGRGRALVLPERKGAVVGVFRATRHGYGFIESPGRSDLFVPRGSSLHALDGDTVQARIAKPDKAGREPHAEIVRIVQRAPIRWVGVLTRQGRHWFVQPQGKMPAPIVAIEDPGAKNAKAGDMVVVEPLTHTLDSHSVQGVIVERLGDPDESTVKILGVIRRAGLPVDFPIDVRGEAQAAAAGFSADIPADREDLRELLTITIDPPTARDFDDAISIQRLPDGQTQLGVHIADVAHYVRPDSALDREALLRGNSAYFPGYVVPMLPEVLSNGVCSLQPHQPRLTKSAFITYDARGRVQDARFANSVIRSHARLTYDQVTDALGGKPGEISQHVLALLKSAEKLAQTIRRRRLDDGMITLTIPTVEIVLGDDGRVVTARPEDTSFSHTIIEMFMVEANEAVCRLLDAKDIPHIRRVHPPPEPDASQRFMRLVAMVGRPIEGELDRKSILGLLADTAGRPEAPTVHFLLLRCLAQACYSASRGGHFALASEHYTHFTSPIRRYPDLVIHRLLEAHFRAARGTRWPSKAELEEVAIHCSMTERRAAEAERDARHLLLLDLMKTMIGAELDGIVTGVTSVGAFVQVQPYLAEGLIHRTELGGQRWEFDRESSSLVQRHGGRVVRMGQRVRVVVAGVDEVRHELALQPAGPFGEAIDRSAYATRQKRTHRPPKKRGKRT